MPGDVRVDFDHRMEIPDGGDSDPGKRIRLMFVHVKGIPYGTQSLTIKSTNTQVGEFKLFDSDCISLLVGFRTITVDETL